MLKILGGLAVVVKLLLTITTAAKDAFHQAK
jgi:hypothetical protein